ncbi:MAG: YlbF family regulator [Lachnospiraceae bacterium]|nr:YlbF family regulator [Lachnospiraceae bacterium]
MDKITECTNDLVRAIQESEDYRRYRSLQEKLDQQPELKGKIDEFRVRNYHLQRQDNVDLFDAVDRLEEDFKELRKDTLVNAYLEAEVSVCRAIQRIQNALSENLKISVPEQL